MGGRAHTLCCSFPHGLQMQLDGTITHMSGLAWQFREVATGCNSSWADLRGFGGPKTSDEPSLDDWPGAFALASKRGMQADETKGQKFMQRS